MVKFITNLKSMLSSLALLLPLSLGGAVYAADSDSSGMLEEALDVLKKDEQGLYIGEQFLGDPDAPIIVFEYFSYTCPYCANFAKNVFPKIKEEYIDTGKVKYVARDYPLNAPAFNASTLAQCLGNVDEYFALKSKIFSNLDNFLRNPSPTLRGYVKELGKEDSFVTECAQNSQVQSTIIARQNDGAQEFGIRGIPHFEIDGKSLAGFQSYEQMKRALDSALAKAEQ